MTWGTGNATAGTPDPFAIGSTGQEAANDVSASFFLLLRNEQLTPAVFVCPSSNAQAWDYGGGSNSAQNWVDWIGTLGCQNNLSYSYEDPFAGTTAISNGWQLKNPDSTYAICADVNPGTTVPNTTYNPTNIQTTAPASQMRNGNSPNHQQDGQNVLFGDGHAEWETTCYCGTQHDNIYTGFGASTTSPGANYPFISGGTCTSGCLGPYDGQDSILLPNANGK